MTIGKTGLTTTQIAAALTNNSLTEVSVLDEESGLVQINCRPQGTSRTFVLTAVIRNGEEV